MKTYEIGRHTLTYGDDGISVIIYRGPVSYDEMKAIIDTDDFSYVPPAVLLLCDFREAGRISPEARRLGATHPKPSKRYYTAYVGVSFSVRMIIDMWNRATNFLHGEKYVAAFFDDHASARAWLLARKEAFEKGPH